MARRPADLVGAAIRVAESAAGEEPEEITDNGKDKAAAGTRQEGREGEGGKPGQEAADGDREESC